MFEVKIKSIHSDKSIKYQYDVEYLKTALSLCKTDIGILTSEQLKCYAVDEGYLIETKAYTMTLMRVT